MGISILEDRRAGVVVDVVCVIYYVVVQSLQATPVLITVVQCPRNEWQICSVSVLPHLNAVICGDKDGTRLPHSFLYKNMLF